MNFVDYLLEGHRNSGKEFVVGRERPVRFVDLYERSSRIGNWLTQEIGREQYVLLMSENSVFFITTYLAIMRSGNVCIPLPPDISDDNLRYIVKHAGVRLAIVGGKRPDGNNLPGVRILDEAGVTTLSEATRPGQEGTEYTEEGALAQIIFTSGSTGVPKGVMLSHKNLISNTASIIHELGLTADDRMEVVLPFSYCYGLSLLHTHLKVGGSIVLNNHFRFIGTVLDDLVEYKCTGFAGVPSHFQILFRRNNPTLAGKIAHLKYMTQAGGKLANEHIRKVMDRFSGRKFFVMYGQTEATARLSILEPDRLKDKLGSVGKGIAGVQLEIFDADGRTLPPGEAGEVVAKGDNVMMGYFKDPDMTATTIKNGWLHTGDIGFVDEDGYVFLQGRKKDIIKTGGERVSPFEVKEALLTLPWIADCQIHGIPNDILGEIICAKVVLKKKLDHEFARRDIVNHCRDRMAQHKIPKIIEFVGEQDLTAKKGMM